MPWENPKFKIGQNVKLKKDAEYTYSHYDIPEATILIIERDETVLHLKGNWYGMKGYPDYRFQEGDLHSACKLKEKRK